MLNYGEYIFDYININENNITYIDVDGDMEELSFEKFIKIIKN